MFYTLTSLWLYFNLQNVSGRKFLKDNAVYDVNLDASVVSPYNNFLAWFSATVIIIQLSLGSKSCCLIAFVNNSLAYVSYIIIPSSLSLPNCLAQYDVKKKCKYDITEARSL